jgi:hypothetical protein
MADIAAYTAAGVLIGGPVGGFLGAAIAGVKNVFKGG